MGTTFEGLLHLQHITSQERDIASSHAQESISTESLSVLPSVLIRDKHQKVRQKY